MTNITIILKPTLACNSNCKYCYFKHIRTNNKMSLIIFQNILNKLQHYNKINFIWHGGEPLLMGIDFFNQCIKLQQKTNLSINNIIQTNLTLLNDNWIEFFKKNCFTISTSLDGIKDVHEINRQNFDIITTNIIKLDQNNIHVGGVSVTNINTIPYLYENFNLFKELNMSIRINPEIHVKNNNESITTNNKVYEFIVKFYYDLYLGNKKKNRIDPACEISDFIDFGKSPGCIFGQKSCVGRFPAILWNGDVIHCGRFVGTEHGYLGNVNDPNFSFGLDNPNVLKYYNMDLERIKKCEPCKYYELCHGGCFHHALILGNGKDPFCEAYKGIFKHILTRKNQLEI